ncbi:UNVERIFIED_CONTAM: hypothetical protein K2H54_066990 [Gekko kuhli]
MGKSPLLGLSTQDNFKAKIVSRNTHILCAYTVGYIVEDYTCLLFAAKLPPMRGGLKCNVTTRKAAVYSVKEEMEGKRKWGSGDRHKECYTSPVVAKLLLGSSFTHIV